MNGRTVYYSEDDVLSGICPFCEGLLDFKGWSAVDEPTEGEEISVGYECGKCYAKFTVVM